MTATVTEKPWLPAECRRVVAEVEARLAARDSGAIEREVMRLVEAHERHMDRDSIGLNAGTNVMNPRARRRCSRARSATARRSDIPATNTRWAWSSRARSRW